MNKKKKRRSSEGKVADQSSSTPARSESRSTLNNFDPDYTYVKKDLRTIGILAGIFITILVVLSFFI